ncbi:MAG TPA: ribokinase [Rugosimonospora sp.]|nr:ribokinase [Rugosimonospora sp.]
MMAPRVTVLGSANMDLVGVAERLPRAGETVLGNGFRMIPGGKGANQAVAAARAGADATVVAVVGDDAFGPLLRGGLERAGVGTHLLRVAPGPSGVALIAVDAKGENQILVAPGANATLEALHGPELAAVTGAQALVCQLETPLGGVVQAATAARDAGAMVVLNAAPARSLPAELLAATSLLVVNQGEAETLAGRPGAGVTDLLEVLLSSVPRVAVTLGAAGVAYADRDGLRLDVAAPTVTAVDTTAAGDAFVGALTVAWLEGTPVETALRWACAAGAACAATFGAADSLPHRTAIDDLYSRTYGGTR